MKKILSLVAISALLFSCKKNEEEKKEDKVYNSAQVQVHNGKAWSSLTVSHHGDPKQLALVINDAALNSSPLDGEDHPQHNAFIIPVHQKATEATPFKFIMLNWNRYGHEPSGIYDVPHYDMHYYLSTPDEVMNYTDFAKIENSPAADYLPANHIGGAPVPMMGKHWIDLASPELSGQVPFTQTFIYGSYDGKVVFYEPMITLDFLKNTTEFERPLPQPAKFKTTGYYPTKMKIKKKNNTTEIIFDGFVKRQAS